MQTEILLGQNPEPTNDIPQDWNDRNMLTNQAPIEDDSKEGSSTIQMRESAEPYKQPESVDVRETSERAVAVSENDPGYEDYLRKLYKIPEGGEVSPLQRIFVGIAQELHDINQNTIDRKYGVTAGVSESRSKAANARSMMLKMIMPELSRENGEKLASAMQRRDGATVERIMKQIGAKLHKQLNKKNRK